ncbi:MAG: hypothetical protein J6X35_11445 [Bacteroidales bacterium]|nr:hypothetical protein [Bacteroidales bacterium]
MKTVRKLLVYVVIMISFVACHKEIPFIKNKSDCDLTQIQLKDYPDETLKYIGQIGKDFDAALDSLFRYLNCPSEVLYLKIPIEVYFDCDNREFYGISFADEGEHTDVLDTKGNYYTRKWHNALK